MDLQYPTYQTLKHPEELSPREAAQMMGVRLDLTYSLIWSGKLPAQKREGRWFIPIEAVERRMKQREARRGK